MLKNNGLAAFVFFISFIASSDAVADWSNKTRAFTMVPSSQDALCTEEFRESVRNLKSIGANTLSIAIAYFQDSLTSSDLYPYRRTTTDDALRCGISYLKSEGLDFGLNMMINVPGWRANTDPVDRDEWFRQMGDLAVKYSRDFAAVYGAKHFSLGTEMYKLVSIDYNQDNAASPGRYRWPDIIADVRENYNGTITYSAQHSGNRSAIFDNNDLMPNLDVLGFSAYFPLYASDDAGLSREWQRVERETILPAFNRYGKQLVISELGYRPCYFTHERPYDSQSVCDYDGEIQALAWDSVLNFFSDKTYLDGMIGGWAWSDDPNDGGPTDTDYTPWNKPATNTFRSYWPIIEDSGDFPVFTPPVTNDGGYVFARTDVNEFRWIEDGKNIWISEACATSLGGPTRSGRWEVLNSLAPAFDQASDPCTGGVVAPTPQMPSDGFVFARSDADEYRWVFGLTNIWISESCASELGGATQTGSWGELNAIAPGFDQADNPCSDIVQSSPSDGNGSTTAGTGGYVFSRTDTAEFRWIAGTNNIWISSDCATSLGGAIQSGNWSELNAIAPGFDQATDPCTGPAPSNEMGETSNHGFVFSRTDTSEFRWVDGTQNVWISESCAISLGGATQSGDWSYLNSISPEFDAAIGPCDGVSQPTSNADGLVFARTDSNEFRWVVGGDNVWISESCATSLGGATMIGTWFELNELAPGFDRAVSPCR